MVISTESAHHEQYISTKLVTALPFIIEIVGVLWEAGPQTGKTSSLGVSQRFRSKTVDNVSCTVAAGRLDLRMSGRSRVLSPAVAG